MQLGNRWLVVLGAVLGLAVGNGPIMQFTFGVLLKPITAEFGWTRGAVSSAMVVGLCATAVCVPMAGRLVDRYGIQRVVVPAIMLFAGALCLTAWFASTPLTFILLYCVMGIAAAGQTPLPYATAITAWFDDRRGLALGVAMAGVGIGASLMPQLAQYLVGAYGWRWAYVGLGATLLVLGLPAAAWLVRMPASAARQTGVGVTMEGFLVAEAIRRPAFWMLAISFFIVAACANGTIAHLVPLLTDRGIDAATATAALSGAGVSLIVGRLFAGYLLDRVFAPYVAAWFFLLPLAGIVLLMLGSGSVMTAAAVMLIGLGLGAEVDLIAFMLSRYFGLRSFGELYGYLFALFILGSGVGPFVMGVAYDKSGSYTGCLTFFAAALALAALLILRLGQYTYPVRRDPAAAAPSDVVTVAR